MRWGVPALLLLTQCAIGTGCSSSGGGSILPPAIHAGFAPSATPVPAADLVYLRGAAVNGDTVTVEVAIGGSTTSSDLYSFAFDLVLGDPTVAEYTDQTAVFGTALTLSAGQGQFVEAAQNGDRVVCGVTKTTHGAGNGIGNAQPTIVSLDFRLLKVGTTTLTLAGPPAGGSPAALDSAGIPIGSVTFDLAPAQLSGT